MGKGLALAFKRAFPEHFASYRAACTRGEVEIGRMHVTESGRARPRWIVAFPTKRHWRARSRLADVEAGLVALARELDERAIESIAVPALGCGLGGLGWTDVRPAIERALATTRARVLLFGPQP
jgi:O-acetyl-ADP-ribose deacetylase (regulator of RNase III)